MELEVLEKEINGVKFTIKELDYIEQANYEDALFEFQLKSHLEDEALGEIEALGLSKDESSIKKRELELKSAHLETDVKKVIVQAFEIPTILIDSIPLEKEQIPSFLKKIKKERVYSLLYEINSIGLLKEDEGKK